MEILAHQVADVECLSQLPGKEEGFDLALRLFEQLVAISDVSRERNKYETFLQRGRHILPMSSFFPRVSRGKRGKSADPSYSGS